MTKETNKLLGQALKLPPERRAAVAWSLLESLNDNVDEDAEADRALQIARRAAEMDEGSVATVPCA